MKSIDKKIAKRLVILTGKKAECIYDDLEKSRRDKEMILQGMRGKSKRNINAKELYRILVRSYVKSPPKNGPRPEM